MVLSLAPGCQQSKGSGEGHAVTLAQEAAAHWLECTSQPAFFGFFFSLLGEGQL